MGKKKLSLSTVYFMRFCIPGIMWVVYGILNFFDDESMPLKIISSVCMLLSIIVMLLSRCLKQDKEDDASRFHFWKSCTITLFITLIVIMVLSTISVFSPKQLFDFNLLYPFIIGIILLFIGGWFIYTENWGDDTLQW